MWKIIRTAQVAVVALLLTVSCTKDPMDGGGLYDKEYVDFTMELQPPGGYTPAESRAMTDNEQNAINSATVLVYNSADQTLLYHVQGSVSANKLTVKLKTSQKESDIFDVVVIGNPSADFNPTAGQTKTEIQAALTSNVPDKWAGTEFMMWGERKNTLIKPTTHNFKIEMLRSLARIDVGVGDHNQASETWSGLPDFVLTEVRVVNRRNKFAVIPLPENVNTEGKVKVTAPSVPKDASVIGKTAGDALKYSGADIQNGTVTGEGAYINSGIFVAEAPTTPDNDRVTLIIGGTYNGTVSYYRMDLRVPKAVGDGYDYLPILRNYRYRITIYEILAAGATTADEALASPPMDNIILTTLEPLSENGLGGDILSDANNYITSDASEVQIYDKPDGEKKYNLFTVKAGTKTGVTATGTVTGPGISGSLTLTNGVSQLVNAAIPAGTGIHTYTVAFGTLQKTINVTVIKTPLTGIATVLPFTEVASITANSGDDCLTFSHNETYVQSEQKSGFIEGDAQGKAYIHLLENISSTFTSRAIQAFVTHNNSRGTTRVMLIQEGIMGGEILGYFGGDPKNTMNSGEGTMYPKQLVVAPTGYANWISYKTTNTDNDPSIVNSVYYGRDMNIAAAKLSGGETLANYPAFAYCASLNKDFNGDGIIDDSERIWYLPSLNQLMAIWIFNGELDFPLTTVELYDRYLSATQNLGSVGSVLGMFFGTGDLFSNEKVTKSGYRTHTEVRCVRDL